jgi:hypothetical protein
MCLSIAYLSALSQVSSQLNFNIGDGENQEENKFWECLLPFDPEGLVFQFVI